MGRSVQSRQVKDRKKQGACGGGAIACGGGAVKNRMTDRSKGLKIELIRDKIRS